MRDLAIKDAVRAGITFSKPNNVIQRCFYYEFPINSSVEVSTLYTHLELELAVIKDLLSQANTGDEAAKAMLRLLDRPEGTLIDVHHDTVIDILDKMATNSNITFRNADKLTILAFGTTLVKRFTTYPDIHLWPTDTEIERARKL